MHPADRHLLAMKWRGGVYIDTCLPFSLRSAPKLFNVMADLLEWILHQGVSFLLHYLDNFLTMGGPQSQACQGNLNIIVQVCQLLNIPLALEKVEGPTTCLEFLGITLDINCMEARLPLDKLFRVRHAVSDWLDKKCATQWQILSLVGLLQHAAKVVRPGRVFVRQTYRVTAHVRDIDHYTQLNKEYKSDLYWWHTFAGGIPLLAAGMGSVFYEWQWVTRFSSL